MPRKRSLVAVAALIVPLSSTPSLAADPPKGRAAAKSHYERGVTQFNLGHFEEAITAFEQAYELDPMPILLFNIAQAHRQNGNAERAIFFYKRYLSLAPEAKNADEVRKRIADLEVEREHQNDLRQRPPRDVTPPDQTTTPPVPTQVTVSEDPSRAREPTDPSFCATLGLGSAVPFFGRAELGSPMMFSSAATGEYAIPWHGMFVDVGAQLSVARLSHRLGTTDAQRVSYFPGVLATLGLRRPVAPGLSLGASLGAGVVWWTGLVEDNVFTDGGAGASGAVPMPTARLALSASYDLPGGAFLVGRPELSLSKTTSPGLTRATSRVLMLGVVVGGGFRF